MQDFHSPLDGSRILFGDPRADRVTTVALLLDVPFICMTLIPGNVNRTFRARWINVSSNMFRTPVKRLLHERTCLELDIVCYRGNDGWRSQDENPGRYYEATG